MTFEQPGQDEEFQTYRPYLLLLARLKLSPQIRQKIDPSDVVQEVFLRAHANQAQFRGTTTVEWIGWLRSILANSLAETLRHFRTHQRDLTLERSLERALEKSSTRLERFLADGEAGPSEAAVRQELWLRLAARLMELPEDQRTALELRHFEGLSVPEVARTMDRTTAGVAGLLRRGLARLRELMDETR